MENREPFDQVLLHDGLKDTIRFCVSPDTRSVVYREVSQVFSPAAEL